MVFGDSCEMVVLSKEVAAHGLRTTGLAELDRKSAIPARPARTSADTIATQRLHLHPMVGLSLPFLTLWRVCVPPVKRAVRRPQDFFPLIPEDAQF